MGCSNYLPDNQSSEAIQSAPNCMPPEVVRRWRSLSLMAVLLDLCARPPSPRKATQRDLSGETKSKALAPDRCGTACRILRNINSRSKTRLRRLPNTNRDWYHQSEHSP